jgi:phage host-nuclease inhibitor protein Gam
MSSDGNNDSVKVICRVRPFSKREIDIHLETHGPEEPLRPIISMEGNDTIFLDPDTFVERERFTFDHSLWSISEDSCEAGSFVDQEEVMRRIGLPAVAHVWAGFNMSLFAYGQTGSGKTYTMMGSDEEPGLIPRMCQELFHSLEAKRNEESTVFEGTTKEYRLEARFLEIYNDKVKDLLWELRDPNEPHDGIDHENLKVRHLPSVGPIIVGLTSVVVDNWESCLRLIEEGTKHRSVAATKMNATSSRSHSIFRLNFVQTTRIIATRPYEKPKAFDKVSNVSLVDLAGSERNKKTGAQGDRLKEAVAINKSLTALKNVIDALVEGRPVIPFRDSQLTFLLSESLGGNSKTFMIACASPHSDNADETLNTLRYALRAQGIVCHATVNESEEFRKMNQMRHQLEQLRQLKEEPHEQLTQELRRAHEGKKEQLLSMQSVSAQQHALEQELQRHVDMGGELRHNSKYQMAFRVTFAKRVEQGCQRFFQKQEEELEGLRAEIRDSEKSLQSALGKRSSAAKNENDAKTLFRAREKELEALRARSSALEWRKRSLMKQDEQLRLTAERKLNLKPTIALVAKVITAYNVQKHLKMYNACVEATEEAQRVQAAQMDVNAVSRQQMHHKLVEDAKGEIVRLEKEVSAARNKLHQTQQSFSNRIQALHAECIFLETEIKEISELQEKGTAGLGKSKAAAFFAAKEEAASKLQASSHSLQQRVVNLVSEMERQLSETASSEEQSLARVQEETLAAELRVVDATACTVEQFNKAQSAENERIEAINRESFAFLSTHRQVEGTYRTPFEQLASWEPRSDDARVMFELLFDPNGRQRACNKLSEMLKRDQVSSVMLNRRQQVDHASPSVPIVRAEGPTRKVIPLSMIRPQGKQNPLR